MAEGDPQPIDPPVKPPQGPSESSSGETPHGGPWKLECPFTRMIRVYSNQESEGTISVQPRGAGNCDKKHRYWVDIEVIDLVDLQGVQWRGPDMGNFTQKTLQELDKEKNGNKGKDLVKVAVKKGVDPKEKEEEQAGLGDGEFGQDEDDVVVHAKDCMKMVTRQWAVERTFRNKQDKPGTGGGTKEPGGTQPGLGGQSMSLQSLNVPRFGTHDLVVSPFEDTEPPAQSPPVSPTDPGNQPHGSAPMSVSTGGVPNTCRKGQKWRIQFNNIDDEFLSDGQPPDVPKEYREAVTKTKDTAPLFLHVEVPESATMMRGKGLGRVHVRFQQFWQDGKIKLPGAKPSGGGKESKEPHIRLDPYQVIVNFGPDGLAVEIKASGNPSGSDSGGGGGGAFGGIAQGITGGAVPAG